MCAATAASRRAVSDFACASWVERVFTIGATRREQRFESADLGPGVFELGDRVVAFGSLRVQRPFEVLDPGAGRAELDEGFAVLGLVRGHERIHPGDFRLGVRESQGNFVACSCAC